MPSSVLRIDLIGILKKKNYIKYINRCSMDKKIGVIGLGNIGNPLFEALKYYHKNVFGYDKFKEESDSWKDILETDIVFICVPTTTSKTGRLDMGIVKEVLDRLEKDNYKGVVATKSTLGLGFIEQYIKNTKLKIVVFPEWLREVSAFPDTLCPEIIVLGGSKELIDIVLDTCCWINNKKVNIVKPGDAVMIKLAANALASTKISFANQIMLIAKSYDLDYKNIMNVLMKDPRTSPRYLIPGSEYGGHCLPKDTKELSNQDVDILFKAVENVNETIKKMLKK
jgi:UDPglucose 6-dehydrogenase